MAEITINGVKYTNVPNKKAGTKFAASLTQSNIGASQAVQDYVNSAYFYPLVNAIDINWNGVEVEENSYINTTSDLISYIASKESNVDLSSYATMTYVNDKISEVIGGAPETLDTLKELADALENEASLAYVTEALAGKADVNNVYTKQEVDNLIPAPVDLSSYATNSYVTTELDKKANKSDIVQADMCETDTTSKSYVLNNPYQYHVKSLYGTNYNCYNLVIPHNAKQQFFSDFVLSTLVIGDDHYINASYGIIQGKGNRINTICEAAFGKYNVCDTSSNNTIFTVGNGTASKKHNAFAIRKNGTIYIADTEDGTPYSLQSSLNSKANANDVYTKTEVDNMIPESADLRNYVSYTQANSYYMTVEGPKQVINSVKTFVGNKLINFRQSALNDKLGFTLYNSDEKDVGGLEYRPNTINRNPLISLQHYVNDDSITQSYLGFRQTRGSNKYHLLAPIPSDVATIENITDKNYKNFFIPLVFKNGSNKVYTDCTGLVDMASLMPDLNDYTTTSYVTTELDKKADKTQLPDMTQYVTMTSYNALYEEVQHLAYLISYYHPTPEPTPTPTPTFEFTYGTGLWTVRNSGMDSVAQWLNNTTGYTANYSSGNANVMVDPSTGVLSWTIGGETATITATANAGMYTTSMNVYTDRKSKLTPVAQWTANGMNYGYSISVSPSQGLTTLTFSGFPAGEWTFSNPAVTGITVDTSTGSITVDPTYASAGTYYVSVSYPGDATYDSYSGTFTITVESGKQSAIGNWYDSNNIMTSNKAVVSGDTTIYTFTFQSTPASGWSFSNPMMTGITVNQSNGTITIDPSGMPDSAYPINVTASYMEDSSYWASMVSFSIKVLPEGSNPDFYYESSSINLSNTMPSQSPMIHNSLASYDHIGYSSSNSNVATVNSYGTIEYVGPGECTVTATAYDSSNNILATSTVSVTCTHSKSYPNCTWYDSNHMMLTSKAIAYGDNTSYTFTFGGTPSTGWTFTDTSDNRVTANSSGDITIDPTQGSGTGQVTQFASYTEDSDYYQGGGSFRVIFLEQGADPKFYFEDPSIYLYAGQTRNPMIHCDYMYNTRTFTSDDSNVATVNSMGEIQNVSEGTCTITATIYDSNNDVISTATVHVTCAS